MKNKINVAILGSTGYTGLELVSILLHHPSVSLIFLGSESNAGKYINSFDKRLNDVDLPKLDLINNLNFSKIDVVFFALPHSISQNIIKDNFNKCIFIDLSADFRIDSPEEYRKNYKIKHSCSNLLKKFIYGLPEINEQAIKSSKNIAVPGCYPTSILLPLLPLIRNKLILPNNIIIDSKSGYSGAGKKFNTDNLIKDNKLNFYNYNTNNHRHICEIYQELKKSSDFDVKFSFNPHILPIFRGMMSTIYCNLQKGQKKHAIENFLKKTYSKNYFIKILNQNESADFYSVNNTNNCLIKFYNHYDEDKIIIVSLIDNLLKGASGQAVQCMNLIFGLEENIGLVKY